MSKHTDFIDIIGARVHNLKNISVQIPRNRLVVITGLSGSGKSSLAFDTLFADGQRRYVESLSSYARQFLGRMAKPEVDRIDGVSPAIAIEQKVNTRNPRSTVATSTEIYDYLKLLFSRVGHTFSPVSGNEVKRNTVQDVIDFILSLPTDSKVFILAPYVFDERPIKDQLEVLIQQGFSRLFINETVLKIDEFVSDGADLNEAFLLIDRLMVNEEIFESKSRIADSVQTAYYEGHGDCSVAYEYNSTIHIQAFSDKFELDGIRFEEPTTNFFSFNNPVGACTRCEGFGTVIGIDPDLVIPDKSKSVYEGAIAPWNGEKMSEWKNLLVLQSPKFNFPIHRPFNQLSNEQKDLLWTGNSYFQGLNEFFQEVENQSYKIQYRVLLSRYRGRTVCPDCRGTRLRKDASYVKVGGKSITDILLMSVEEAFLFFSTISLSDFDMVIAEKIIKEISNRLKVLLDVGLPYLSLNRRSNSLSGGESQRINLATSLGSSLVGSMYILDEPSIGLHPRDSERLIKVLKDLRDLGNTVIVVEHDEDIMKASDYIVDIGPLAGRNGGELVFQGGFQNLLKESNGLTAKYLRGDLSIPKPKNRRPWNYSLHLNGVMENNLKNVTVEIPLGVMTMVTGVSGSGKSSLIRSVLYPALAHHLGGNVDQIGKHDSLTGDIHLLKGVELIDQNPIGRSSRSNPVTYIKAFDDIRSLYASQKLAKLRGYKPGYFSFNVPGGRCEMCQGDGVVKVEMQFMADIYLRCEHCNGKRFKDETLEVTYKSKHIADILEMTVDEALDFFSEQSNKVEEKIREKIKVLQDVGLGYVQLGQQSATLSGGEAQRIKLAFHLTKGSSAEKMMFIFDEPTTGLHYHDINKLYDSLVQLIRNGHSVVIIEHNLELIKCADWIIDIGPEGGDKGGEVVFAGDPEKISSCDKSHTAKYLQIKL
ncbi:MAG: excinuclease ABC subunit UvrA [Bacteroidales bacterium]|nr:excinuclease ABC subunit UvrA [Bacteroidales bacterium]